MIRDTRCHHESSVMTPEQIEHAKKVFAKWAGKNPHDTPYLTCYEEMFLSIAGDLLAPSLPSERPHD